MNRRSHLRATALAAALTAAAMPPSPPPMPNPDRRGAALSDDEKAEIRRIIRHDRCRNPMHVLRAFMGPTPDTCAERTAANYWPRVGAVLEYADRVIFDTELAAEEARVRAKREQRTEKLARRAARAGHAAQG